MAKTEETSSMWKVPLFNISFDKMELEAVGNVISSGWLSMGDVTEKFETLFAEFIGARHAMACSSGTAALHLANRALFLDRNDEVICPSLTFVAGANSILYTGARPIFADITSYDNFNISPEDIEKKITDKTRAIQIMHYAGYPCDMERIMKIADVYSLKIIEDCSHAPGAEYNGKKCGTLGDIGCFSFFSNKNMTTAEGGMITTDSDDIANLIRSIRSHGMTTVTLDRHRGHAFSYNVEKLGFNYRIDDLRSAIGIVQLQKLTKANVNRRRLIDIYRQRLSHVEDLHMPFIKHVGVSSYHICPIVLGESVNRQNFMAHLKSNGIQSSIHYPPIHQFDFYRSNFSYHEGSLALTENIANREVTLPLYPSMHDEDVHYICDTIDEYLRKGKKK